MGLMDILQHYINDGTRDAQSVPEHFDQVAQEAPRDVLGASVADAFRSDQTPAFPQMVGQLFGQSNPQQQAGLLNQLLSVLGPGALAGLGGGAIGRMLGAAAGAAPVTPTQATQLSPQQVQEMATHAEQRDPGIIDKLGGFYGAHPELVRTLGSAALAIALAGVANRMKR